MKDKTGSRDMLGTPRDIARDIARANPDLAAFGVIAAGATIVGIVESYSNLYAFAHAYGLSGWRAAIAPGAVDSFIIMGELLLFATARRALRGRMPYIYGAALAAWGFALSVAGNVWHAPSATISHRAVSAIWPVTATAGLAGALIIVRQIMKTPGTPAGRRGRHAGTDAPPAAVREEPRRVRPSRAAGDRPPGPAALSNEAAWTAELTAAGLPLPPYRSWAHKKTGMYRTAGTRRAYDQAREQLASVNGGSHGDGGS